MGLLLIAVAIIIFSFSFIAGLDSDRRIPSISAILVSFFGIGIAFLPFLMPTTSLGAGFVGMAIFFILATFFIPPVLGYWSGFAVIKIFQYLEIKLDGPKSNK